MPAENPPSTTRAERSLGLLVAGNAALAAIYILLGTVSLKLATVGPFVTPVWLPGGVAFAVLTVYGFRLLPGVSLGTLGVLASSLLDGMPWLPALGIMLGQTLAPAVGALAARRLARTPRELVDSAPGIARLVFFCAYGSSVFSATLGTGSLIAAGLLVPEMRVSAWLTWWLGDALGIVVIAPVMLAWAYREPSREGALRSLELAAIATAVLGLTWLTFHDVDIGLPNYYLQFYAVTPFLIWLALRFPLLIVSMVNLALAAIVIQAVLNDHGFNIAPGLKERFEAVHGFLIITSFGLLALASTVAQRTSAQRVLAQSEGRFKALVELSSDWYWELGADLRLMRVDGRSKTMAGVPFEERIGKRPWEMPYEGTDDGSWVEHRRRLEAHQAFYDFIVCGRDGRGDLHYARLSGEPVFDEHGAFQGYRGLGKDMTREMRMQEALRRSESRFRHLTELSSDWYWEMDAEGRFVRVDGPGMDKSHILPHIMIGKSVCELPDLVADDDFRERCRVVIGSQRPFRDLLLPRRGRQQRLRYALMSGEPVRDEAGRFIGYTGVGKDVTSEVEAREALLVSEKRLRTLVEANPDLIVMKDAKGRWTVANQAMLHANGLVMVDWYGKTDEELLAISGRPALVPRECPCADRHQWVDSSTCRCEETLVTDDGNERTFDFVATKLQGEEGEYEGVIILGREITHLKRSESIQEKQLEVIRSLNDELENRVHARTVALETANRELEAFSYSVSHDLRGPLRALNGFSRLLEEDYGGQLSGEARNYLDRIRRASERMGELIDDLLKLSRISRSQVKRQPVDLSSLAQEILDELRLAEPGRMVQTVVQPRLEASVDAGLVRVLLDNLLRNAWKFTRREPEASIEFGRIIRRRRPFYFVRDNGAGFSMEHAARLFAPFQRLHHAHEFEGTGIGLAIVQRIVRLHGGEVEAEGRPDAGAVFYFTLDHAPRRVPDEGAQGGGAASARAA